MEKRLMGKKKKFLITDFQFYIGAMAIPFMVLVGIVQIIILIIITLIFQLESLKDILVGLSRIWWVLIYLFIIFKLRKFYYYEIVKKHMKEKYSFSVSSEEIELLFKDKNIIIPIDDIEKICIYRYISPFKKLYIRQCKWTMMRGTDSNFCKDITTIEIKIKSGVDTTKFKKRGIYYNLFNYRKKIKTNDVVFKVYEIMYDNKSDENIKYITKLSEEIYGKKVNGQEEEIFNN